MRKTDTERLGCYVPHNKRRNMTVAVVVVMKMTMMTTTMKVVIINNLNKSRHFISFLS
jgi:hypothetical protein